MAGPPNVGPNVKSVAQRLKLPFRPDMKLDPSQVVDMRPPAGMDWVHWEDGTRSWEPSFKPGGLPSPQSQYDEQFDRRKQKGGGRVTTPNSKPKKAN